MQLFFHPDIEQSPILPKEESRHLVRVLRKKLGDVIEITNGKGVLFSCEIIGLTEKETQLKILSQRIQSPRAKHLTLAVAPTKNIDRFEWMLEKATEIGVEKIVPILCDHSERKVIKPDRLEKIIVAAMKQSLRTYLPKLAPITSFDEAVYSINVNHKWIGHLDEKDPGPDLRNMS
ncbi:MAG: 16S rRNA (uracil(1498)-N(3))-methyltransferase, partial [Flavobacteriales bacterium]|nr:16S rRNA (uracil(1498)-N(3))-methyltransferase [Flavobacteriales bacterium]